MRLGRGVHLRVPAHTAGWGPFVAPPSPPKPAGLVLPAPLVVPPLAQRSAELDRIIAEYAGDAIAELAAPTSSFTAGDHTWVRDHAAASLAEIEKATLRLVAIRTSRNLSGAAARLGMAVVSLSRWLGRRKLPQMMHSDHAGSTDEPRHPVRSATSCR